MGMDDDDAITAHFPVALQYTALFPPISSSSSSSSKLTWYDSAGKTDEPLRAYLPGQRPNCRAEQLLLLLGPVGKRRGPVLVLMTGSSSNSIFEQGPGCAFVGRWWTVGVSALPMGKRVRLLRQGLRLGLCSSSMDCCCHPLFQGLWWWWCCDDAEDDAGAARQTTTRDTSHHHVSRPKTFPCKTCLCNGSINMACRDNALTMLAPHATTPTTNQLPHEP
ncbi:hypothetical protein B0I35DRAFT_200659 [Stachybotrys elegans]|uniref:Uncharacterized protein n=1 Tax=Stachybotrys elegans TaxID=80388 RepID=A0A8K0SRT0_9HYPO|nr:hypothetical protein B0I35DRAFT_200659 [Stachybotrys elegans]